MSDKQIFYGDSIIDKELYKKLQIRKGNLGKIVIEFCKNIKPKPKK